MSVVNRYSPPGSGQQTVAGRPVGRPAGREQSALPAEVLAVRDLGPTALQVACVGSGRLGLFREYGPDAGDPRRGR